MSKLQTQVQTLEQQLFNLQRAVEALTYEILEMRREMTAMGNAIHDSESSVILK
jgi:prefoldin subunit 5